MPDLLSDLCPVLSLLTFAYLAMAAGVGASLLARARFRRGGRSLSPPAATWCAFLPLLSLSAVPGMSWLSSLSLPEPGYVGTLHRAHHAWDLSIQHSSAIHALLHLTNVLLLLFGVLRLLVTIQRVHKMCGSLRALPRLTDLTETVPDAPEQGGYACRLSPPVFLINARQPFCFTAGMFRPRVYLSTALSARLSRRHRAAMLAHEAAHARRRDGLVGLILNIFYSLFPVPGTSVLLAEWQEATERACDEEAAQQLGDACGVAGALVAVAGIIYASSAPAIPGTAAFAPKSQQDLDRRVAALLALRQPSASPAPYTREAIADRAFRTVFLGVVLVADFYLPHAVEIFVHH